MRRFALLAVCACLVLAACGLVDTDASRGTADNRLPVPTTTTAPLVPGSTGPVEIDSRMAALEAGVPHITSSTRIPRLRFVPPSPGWSGSDSMACADALGSLILTSERGRVFVVPSGGMEAEQAIAALDDAPITSVNVTDVRVGDWSGRLLKGVLDLDQPTEYIGGTRHGPSLLPYHTVTEDVLDAVDGGPLMPGDQVEIYVLDFEDGILSVTLVAEAGGMDAFRQEALALAESIEFVTGDTASGPSC